MLRAPRGGCPTRGRNGANSAGRTCRLCPGCLLGIRRRQPHGFRSAPPPLAVSISPPSAVVEIGAAAEFTLRVSGGAPGAAPSWTCTSSDIAVATTLVTGSGCAATGVAGGSATITAEITKGGDTREVTADLEVRPRPLAVSISPPSAVVEVGATAEFTLRVRGGAPGAAPSWRCSILGHRRRHRFGHGFRLRGNRSGRGERDDHGGGHQGKRNAGGEGRPSRSRHRPLPIRGTGSPTGTPTGTATSPARKRAGRTGDSDFPPTGMTGTGRSSSTGGWSGGHPATPTMTASRARAT